MARRQLAQAAAQEIAPPDHSGRQWVHLLPSGDIHCRDGRRFAMRQPSSILAAFAERAAALPVDFEHATEKPPADGKAVPAAGWITKLETRQNGVWGLIEWTASAAQMIRDRAYRYISPAFMFSPTNGEILSLKSAGLVHHPAMRLTALASEEASMNPTSGDFLPRVARALGLAADAREDDVMDAIAELKKGDPSKNVPVDAVAELLRERNEKLHAMGRIEASQKVAQAMDAGYLTPAMRPWALALCEQDPAAFDSFLRSATPAYAHIVQPIRPAAHPPAGQRHAAAGDAEDIAATLGLKPEALLRD
jgi:phage I-like protein